MKELIFLKLGGSLITDKNNIHTALIPQIDLLSEQIIKFLHKNQDVKILIGHGSGSFGHVAAAKFHTREGVITTDKWQGFLEVWSEARALNQIVIERLQKIGLEVICFPLSAAALTEDHQITSWPTEPIEQALEHGLIPVVYGDVVLDKKLGGTILSTEEQFEFLASRLHPKRILLAGLEPGIWKDFPACTSLIPQITSGNFAFIQKNIQGSTSIDVTGGMASKVASMFRLIKSDPELKVQIFSGKEPDALIRVLNGEVIGTELTA